MKTLIIKFILIFQMIAFGVAYAEPVTSILKKDSLEQTKPDLPNDPFLQAEYLFHSGNLLSAKPFYHDYLSQNILGERSHQALFRLGWIDQSSHSYSTAIRFYQILIQKYPRSLLANSARYNMAVCHFELTDYANAEAQFKIALRLSPDKKRKWEIMIRLAQIDGKRMDFEKAFSKLKLAFVQLDDQKIRKRAIDVARNLIHVHMDEPQISLLIQKLGTGFPVDLLLLKKISSFRISGQMAQYVNSMETFIAKFPKHSQREEVEGWLNQVGKDNGANLKIGVVLPMTGKLAMTGQRVLQGIQLAVNLLPLESRKNLALELRDSGNNVPINKIIADLASMPNVVGIIGPLLSDEVLVAGATAQQYQIPIFSPTASTHGLVDNNPYIFRNALTRKIQAKFLAQYSVNNLHLKRFAVLHPFESFGLELKDTFIDEVESLGGEVVAVSGYDRSQNDFKKQIFELGGVEDDDLMKIAREIVLSDGEAEDFSDSSVLSRPVIDMGHWAEDDVENLKVSLESSYDAIFLPGVYDKVGLIIPQLAFYNVNDVTLLGSNGWNSPELVKMGGKYMKRVYFVDGYYPDSDRPRVRKFVQDFKTNFGEKPIHLSAQAFDAANIFIKNILDGVDNRVKMRESLKSVKDFPGITGKTTLLPSGDSEKNIYVFTVKRRKIVQEN